MPWGGGPSYPGAKLFSLAGPAGPIVWPQAAVVLARAAPLRPMFHPPGGFVMAGHSLIYGPTGFAGGASPALPVS